MTTTEATESYKISASLNYDHWIWADTALCLQVVLWGRRRDELHHRIYSQQPIRDWEGQPPHMYGEIIYSSLVSLYNSYTQVTWHHTWEAAGTHKVWLHQ